MNHLCRSLYCFPFPSFLKRNLASLAAHPPHYHPMAHVEVFKSKAIPTEKIVDLLLLQNCAVEFGESWCFERMVFLESGQNKLVGVLGSESESESLQWRPLTAKGLHSFASTSLYTRTSRGSQDNQLSTFTLNHEARHCTTVTLLVLLLSFYRFAHFVPFVNGSSPWDGEKLYADWEGSSDTSNRKRFQWHDLFSSVDSGWF